MSKILIVDTETTGLNYSKHVPFEVSFVEWDIAGKMEPKKLFVALTLDLIADADDKALEVNGRTREWLSDELPKLAYDTLGIRTEFLNLLEDRPTLMGANVRFDARMLEWLLDMKYGEPWSHRLFDIQAYYSGVMGLDEVKGLNHIVEDINQGYLDDDDAGSGWRVTEPNHDSTEDVKAVRDIFAWCRYYVDAFGGVKAPWDSPFAQSPAQK